jgi:hypothetical protein
MFAQPTRRLWFALVLVGFAVPAVLADLPPKQEVVYKLHDDPNDPNSDVVFTAWLTLAPKLRNGDSIAWEPEVIRFRLIGQGGSSDTTWTESNPQIPTTSGYWWITHADADNPQLTEFVDPPHFTGTASADDPYVADLEYDFQGSSDLGDDPWDPTGWLEYEFAMANGPMLMDSADEPQPVSVDPGEEPAE